jgi:hypothetical protein
MRDGLKFSRALAFLLIAACGPSHSAVRAIERGDDGSADGGAGGGGGTGGAGGARTDGPGNGGQGGARLDAANDLATDRAVDLPPDRAADLPPDATPDAIGAGKTVLLVVGFLDPMFKPGDTKLRARLMARGFNVKIGDDDLGVDQAMGTNLVIITHSSGPQVGTKYTMLAEPVIVMEEALFDDLRLTGNAGADHGLTDSTQLTISMAGHPLAAGLTGTITVSPSTQPASWGLPAAAATRVATVQGQNNQIAIFGYTMGAAMAGGTNAPARRVGLFLTEDMAALLTDQAGRLFDAAVDWALQ